MLPLLECRHGVVPACPAAGLLRTAAAEPAIGGDEAPSARSKAAGGGSQHRRCEAGTSWDHTARRPWRHHGSPGWHHALAGHEPATQWWTRAQAARWRRLLLCRPSVLRWLLLRGCPSILRWSGPSLLLLHRGLPRLLLCHGWPCILLYRRLSPRRITCSISGPSIGPLAEPRGHVRSAGLRLRCCVWHCQTSASQPRGLPLHGLEPIACLRQASTAAHSIGGATLHLRGRCTKALVAA